jgi:hypothetical protein
MLTQTRQRPNVKAGDETVSIDERQAAEYARGQWEERVGQLSDGGKLPVAIRIKATGNVIRADAQSALQALTCGWADLAVTHK